MRIPVRKQLSAELRIALKLSLGVVYDSIARHHCAQPIVNVYFSVHSMIFNVGEQPSVAMDFRDHSDIASRPDCIHFNI